MPARVEGGVRMRAFSLLSAACIRLQQQRRLSSW